MALEITDSNFKEIVLETDNCFGHFGQHGVIQF